MKVVLEEIVVGIVAVLVVDITLPGLKEVCLDKDEVEVDLIIKVQMLVDLKSQVELFL